MLAGLDYLVLIAYLLTVAAIGLWAGRSERDTKDYFLGGRAIPWWAAGFSIIATETSALTFIGAPASSMNGSWLYLQMAFGTILARFVVAWVLIPAYYRAQVFTVYGWLEQRFGVWSKNAASVLFFVGRCLGSGVRLYAAALAFWVIVRDANGNPIVDPPLVIAVIALVAVSYSTFGGIKAVIWTDVLQGALLFLGGGLALVFLVTQQPGGVEAILEPLQTAGKLRVFNWGLDFADDSTLIGGVVGTLFLTMATHGTDQDMVQRTLTCANERGGRLSLLTSAALNLPIVILFLAVGSALWVHYGDALPDVMRGLAANAGEADPRKGASYVFPFYVVQSLPAGVKGLILAGLFAAAMSSLDSAIAALSATAVKNVWEPYVQPGRSERHYLRVSRVMSVAFGLTLVGIAIVVWASPSGGGSFGILGLGLKVLSWIFPPLLGVFFVGVFTQRGSDRGNLVALAAGIGLLLCVENWSRIVPGAQPPFAWVWNAFFGCLASFLVAVAFRGRR